MKEYDGEKHSRWEPEEDKPVGVFDIDEFNKEIDTGNDRTIDMEGPRILAFIAVLVGVNFVPDSIRLYYILGLPVTMFVVVGWIPSVIYRILYGEPEPEPEEPDEYAHRTVAVFPDGEERLWWYENELSKSDVLIVVFLYVGLPILLAIFAPDVLEFLLMFTVYIEDCPGCLQ